MFRRHTSSFPKNPYLKALPEQIERFKDFNGKTGVSWRGAQGSIPELREFGEVSLQYDLEWDEDISLIQPDLDLRNDIEGLLGLLANLKKVVTVSTSVAHFSSSLGIETHVVIADSKTATRANIFPWKWICGDSGRTPWYGSARVYRNLRDYRARSKREG
jgi:hypothetical protein